MAEQFHSWLAHRPGGPPLTSTDTFTCQNTHTRGIKSRWRGEAVGGSRGRGGATPSWIAEQGRIAAASGRAWGVGLLAWTLEANPALLDAVADLAPPLVSVSYGPYERHLAILKQAGSAVATQVGTLFEARAAEEAGVDLIVARGGEGGGHGRNDVATLPLLQAVLDHVSVPVLEYGGRALRNRFFERWEGREPELAGDDHAHAELLAALDRNDFDTACIYAGQSVGLIQRPRPAAEVVADLATAAELLRRTGSMP